MNSWDLGHIITNYVNQKGDTVSHKKLQKLLYYVEAWHLVNFGKPILEEEFQAWVHGPVIPELYQKLKDFGFNDLKVINEEEETVDKEIESIIQKNGLDENKVEFIYSVLDNYGSLSSFELELLSHSEKPWIDARGNCAPHERCTTVISKETMLEFYSQL
ncbi:Panacea domain-containing protein [Sphingobacterium sp. Mn56C]|uniref:Panacea domain-containing protein n=1 Tax=Sphingobacterium sp. Mn56C TaxID=3395261 RepID=UPI003BBD92FC